ncbi:restriction endonuclease subunit S [Stutzerimonas stutzeri]|uniref:restriction endonuclease subunit S n=1 Tax=Stutzerimonas stutzeri TaxID=316 RepID=UPI0024492591|nr:restriction endonuclease subunit S [Stutzerimonas stutzeri]MDH0120663.1 restriction endonuclease subunit S [Stutzerimonas stutzeri]
MRRYESYKPSGVEWLGDIPECWDVCRNIGLFDERKEINQPGMELLSVTINRGVIRQEEITEKKDSSNEDKSKYKVVRKDDLAYNKMRMWQGAIGRSEYEGIVSPAYVILVPRDNVYSRYYHFLYRIESFIAEANRHSYGLCLDMNSLRYEDFKTIYSPVPPRSEVERIIAFLDQKTAEIDAAIAKKERLIELLVEQNQILINKAVTRGLNHSVEMKSSGIDWLGDIPVHWKLLPNKALFRERNEAGKPGLPILSVSLHSGVSDQEQNDSENIRAKIRIEDKTLYKRVFPGDVAYNMMRAWQGAIGVVRVDGQVSPAYVVAAPRSEVHGGYFEHLYRTEGFIREMDRFSKGITDFRKRLYWDEFKQLMTLLPPVAEQKAIAEYVEQVGYKTAQACASVVAEIEKLQELRRVIVAQAVTGKIRV